MSVCPEVEITLKCKRGKTNKAEGAEVLNVVLLQGLLAGCRGEAEKDALHSKRRGRERAKSREVGAEYRARKAGGAQRGKLSPRGKSIPERNLLYPPLAFRMQMRRASQRRGWAGLGWASAGLG